MLTHTLPGQAPLTVVELETLAVMLDSASRKMAHVRTADGGHAWSYPMVSETYSEAFTAFYDLRGQSALAAIDAGASADAVELIASIKI